MVQSSEVRFLFLLQLCRIVFLHPVKYFEMNYTMNGSYVNVCNYIQSNFFVFNANYISIVVPFFIFVDLSGA